MSSYFRTRPQRQYTITDAREDIEYLNTTLAGVESAMKSLSEDVDSLRHDEWRALYLCDMLKRRMDIMESLLMSAFTPAGQKYLTHQVLAKLLSEKKGETA